MAAGTTHLVDRVGAFRPKIEHFAELATGEICGSNAWLALQKR